MRHIPQSAIAALFVCAATWLAPPPARAAQTADAPDGGKAVYEFYCYQCHGYAGDARTLAATFLQPRPRDFTGADPSALERDRMIDAVTNGRPGTAMVAFESALDRRSIEQVVDYVRARFMHDADTGQSVYHTPENGWKDHERFSAAFPFATGDIALDTPGEDLTPTQRLGRRLFMHSCITCHDHGRADESQPIWELRPLSYPRRHYDHTRPVDAVSGASPFAVHDRPPATGDLTDQAARGQSLFQDNCAFCHAADGTGRNWIGSFLEPHPRDLTRASIKTRDPVSLHRTIVQGLPGTSMPSWKHALTDPQIDDIVAYIRCCLPETSAADVPRGATAPDTGGIGLTWKSVNPR